MGSEPSRSWINSWISNEVKPLQRIYCAVKPEKDVSHKIEANALSAGSKRLRIETPEIISGGLRE